MPQRLIWSGRTNTGRTITEHIDYEEVAGARKPWVRFTEDLYKAGEWLESLTLNIDGHQVHLPRTRAKSGVGYQPSRYSLQYTLVEPDALGPGDTAENYLELAAHFDNFKVVLMVRVEQPELSWIELRPIGGELAPSPMRKD